MSGERHVDRRLHARLMERVGVSELAGLSRLAPAERRLRVREEALALLREEGELLPHDALTRVVNGIADRVVGFGPIEALLRDPEVTEVMVNGPDDVFVERKGRVEKVPDVVFEGEDDVVHVIERIVSPLGLRIDGSSPCVDARLPDGSRVHAVIPPLSLCGPVLTVRKFALTPLSPEDLVARGALGPRMLAFLAACVRGKANIVISGGTSSGKTTLLNVLASFIPDGERLITIEDAAELQLARSHVVGLEARPPNVEGRGEVTVRELVRNALRMRPDRIIVGEVRGGEALDMLQAMSTGHDGSISTAHANSPRHTLWRLETMALMSDVQLPVAHVRDQVASAIDLIVHVARSSTGRREVVEIATIDAVPGEEPLLTTIFRRIRGASRAFEATGVVPRLATLLQARGEIVSPEWFGPGADVAQAFEGPADLFPGEFVLEGSAG